MKFQITDRINTNATASQLLDALEQQFKPKSESVSRVGDLLRANGIEASFGSINRSDKTEITVRPADGGFLMSADVKYSPSVWFWVILVLTLFTYVFWLIPIAFYLMQKKTVKEGIEDCFRNTINQLSSAGTANANIAAAPSQQSSIADLERLGGLLQQGLITQAEFDSHKAKLFGTATVPAPVSQLPPPIPATQTITNGFPISGGHEPDRLFAMAKEQLASGDKHSAIQTLRAIVERFPESDAATRARRSLAPRPKTGG